MAKRIHKNFALDAGAHPVVVLQQIRLGVRDLARVERLAKFLHHVIVDFEVLRHVVIDDIMLRKVEECIMLQQTVLEVIALDRFNLHVWTNPAAPVNRASAVG